MSSKFSVVVQTGRISVCKDGREVCVWICPDRESLLRAKKRAEEMAERLNIG